MLNMLALNVPMMSRSSVLTAGCRFLAVARPKQDLCIISCGTALTIDLTHGHQHLGGYILPNLYLQRDALIQHTKGIRIPEAAFDDLSPGRNTLDAVHHGILLGLLSTIKHVLLQSPAS